MPTAMAAADLLRWPGDVLQRVRDKPLTHAEMIDQLVIAGSLGSDRARRRLQEIVKDGSFPFACRQKARAANIRLYVKLGPIGAAHGR